MIRDPSPEDGALVGPRDAALLLGIELAVVAPELDGHALPVVRTPLGRLLIAERDLAAWDRALRGRLPAAVVAIEHREGSTHTAPEHTVPRDPSS